MDKTTYKTTTFAVADMEAAKRIILTPTPDQTTDQRWETETPYMAGLLGEQLSIQPGQTIVDYGCGIGRLSKALIERFDCLVLGVDQSEEMRALAPAYVQNAAFSVVSRRMFHQMGLRGFRVDAAFSVWVLQHCVQPQEDIGLMAAVLPPGAPMTVVNMRRRAVPTQERGWYDDGLDVQAHLAGQFQETAAGTLAAELVTARVAEATFWATYRR
ncbi:class I SAM-dependent methyltransferase [Phenylobacterium sp.]|jgi:cyclopropane fatty-acyl-phospholipid synthase-like methyltransferase|uniref:class I SAM-dependent methyltransferase n=1 Tax=Phenylobacterium sp. TaxID=1871053 RepID=UPI002F40660F